MLRSQFSSTQASSCLPVTGFTEQDISDDNKAMLSMMVARLDSEERLYIIESSVIERVIKAFTL